MHNPLHRATLERIEGLGEKSVDALLSGIERSKAQPLARLIAALNIPLVGPATAEMLATRFGAMDALTAADEQALQEVEGIGPEVAASVRQWLDSHAGRETIAALKAEVDKEIPESEELQTLRAEIAAKAKKPSRGDAGKGPKENGQEESHAQA